MKIKLIDRKRPIMRPRENFVCSMKVMEIAFQRIMSEIIEHAIEGICFEAHRAAKLDYFPTDEFVLKEHEFEICNGKKNLPPDNVDLDIYGNVAKNNEPLSICPFCGQQKSAIVLARHIKSCGRTNGSRVNSVEDEDTNDGKKGNDAKKTAKSTLSYDNMSPEEINIFLLKHCGVISKRTKKPCNNTSNCNVHSQEDKDEIRNFIFERCSELLVDGNIDIDTVD